MWGDFLKNWRAQRFVVYCSIMEKNGKKGYITNSTKKNMKSRKWINLHKKMTFWKTTRSKRHSNYSGFRKNRVAARSVWVWNGRCLLAPVCAKSLSKGCLFENHENRKWHQKQTLHKISARGTPKNGPRERVEKHMKQQWNSDRKINVFRSKKHAQSICFFNDITAFACFWTNRRIDAKRDIKTHCRRGA